MKDDGRMGKIGQQDWPKPAEEGLENSANKSVPLGRQAMNFLPCGTVAYSKQSLQPSCKNLAAVGEPEFADEGKDLSIQAFPINPIPMEELAFRKIIRIYNTSLRAEH